MDCNYYTQQPYVSNSFQQQYLPQQEVEATNGPSNKEVVILMGEVIEKLETMDERLQVDQDAEIWSKSGTKISKYCLICLGMQVRTTS